MTKYLFAAAAAISFTTPAIAQDSSDRYRIEQEATRKAAMQWEAAFIVISAADLALTVQCIEANKCEEANPIAKSHSTTQMIAIKSVLTAGHYLFVKRLSKRNPKAALRFAQFSVALHGTGMALNIKTVF